MRYSLLFFISCILCFSCGKIKEGFKESEKAQEIVDKAIKAHGGKLFLHSKIAFDFRGDHYVIKRDSNYYRFERIQLTKKKDEIVDIIDNEGFERIFNDRGVYLSKMEQNKYRDQLNSVVYFALLPYRLNDPAVIKGYLGENKVKNKTYHKVKIGFEKDGGGDHHEDIFYYWFEKETYLLKYFAYSEGGKRFRAAINTRDIGGIIFNDYINYEAPEEGDLPLQDYHRLYEQDKLPELSRIELKNIEVEKIPHSNDPDMRGF